MDKSNLMLPIPLYRGIVAEEGMNAGKMIEGSALYSIIGGEDDISIAPSDTEALIRSIRPETLGMYICKEDMNGKNIFTGDVLKIELEDSVTKELIDDYFLIYYDNIKCAFRGHCSSCSYICDFAEDIYPEKCETIGNIHENPELLKLFPHLQETNDV